eukprot:1663402-Amphidinium_carterae.2
MEVDFPSHAQGTSPSICAIPVGSTGFGQVAMPLAFETPTTPRIQNLGSSKPFSGDKLTQTNKGIRWQKSPTN